MYDILCKNETTIYGIVFVVIITSFGVAVSIASADCSEIGFVAFETR